jgi:hypothetical protein
MASITYFARFCLMRRLLNCKSHRNGSQLCARAFPLGRALIQKGRCDEGIDERSKPKRWGRWASGLMARAGIRGVRPQSRSAKGDEPVVGNIKESLRFAALVRRDSGGTGKQR